MIVTDPRQYDTPIGFANDTILTLTDYSRLAMAGRKCRFLQQPETDPAAVEHLRTATRREDDIRVDLLNDRTDGSVFQNAPHVGPVRDAAGTVLYYFVSQIDVTEHDALIAKVARRKGELAEPRAQRAAR